MPHPGSGFPIPPFEWPHVGRQWPAYNAESDQADGLQEWWSALASRRTKTLRNLITGNDCSFVGSPVWFDTQQMGVGVGGDAAGDRFLLANPVVLAQGTPWTIATWFRYDAAVSLPGLYGHDFVAGSYTRAIYSVAGSAFFIANDGNDNFQPSATLVDGTTYNLVLVDDGSDAGNNVTAYLNAVSLSAGSIAGDDTTITTIGDYDDDGGAAWRGPFFDFRVYDVAKTDAEIYQMYVKPWELHQLPRPLWRLSVVAPPPPTIIPVAMHHYRSARL